MENKSLSTELASLLDQLRGVWRFRWIALIAAWVVALGAWLVVFLLPNTYQASAKIFVDSKTTLSQATEGISLQNNVNDEIDRMTAELLGTPQLRKVANETNLMAGAITPKAQQKVIDALRKNIAIAADVDPRKPNATPSLFTISYQDPNRARSVEVVDHLLNDFVEGSLTSNSEGSQQTEQFLTQQIADYGQRLSQTEQQLADFKKRNMGMVPGEQGDYFSRLQSDESSLNQLKQSLYVAQRKRDAIAQELKTGQQFTTSGHSSAPSATSAAALDTQQQIAVTQQRLDQMLLKYTDRYPDVIALKQTLKELEARQTEQLAAAKQGDLGAATALGLAANPVYQKVEEQYNDELVEVASIQQAIADREQDIAKMKGMMSSAPAVQAEYAQLMRNYAVTKKQYDALLARLDSARLGQQAASTGLVKFQVIDPPSAQFQPVSPNRPLLIIGTFFLALGAGAGIAYLLHLFRPVFVSAAQLGTVTGLSVIGAVSMAWADRHRVERRRGNWRYAAFAGGLVLVAVAVLLLELLSNDSISTALRELFT
jgi:polysaccharide chain length determinant protein (PEP-CTERM system associated)